MKYPNARILVFTKAPTPGLVKTRLLPMLTAHEAAALHAELVHRTLATAVQASLCPVELWCAPTIADPFLQQCHKKYAVKLFQQPTGNLGERMKYALEKGLQQADSAVLIGTDCPMLTSENLDHALNLLQHQKRESIDVVLGPAEDGGYVLIGMKRSHPSLFNNIEWSSERVLTTTRQRIEELGWSRHEMSAFWDLDRPEDWSRYQHMVEKEREQTAAALKEHNYPSEKLHPSNL